MKGKPASPPKILMSILRRLSVYEEMFGISRDFEIEFGGILGRRGRIAACSWLVWNTLQVLLHYFKWIVIWRTVMIRNYFRIALRNIKRHKLFSFINIMGLSLGMACMILILLWVSYETSFDGFHENADRVFRVANENRRSTPPSRMAVTPPPLGPALLQDSPEIEAVSRLSRGGGAKLFSFQDRHFFESFYAVDPSFLRIFSLDFSRGDPGEALQDPYALVLSETMAGKLFGNQDPMGKIIQFDQKTDFRVAGVFKDIPSNSHILYDIFIPFETCLKLNEEPLDNWMYWSFYTYILLKPNARPERLEARFPAFAAKYGIPEAHLFLQPLKSIHLHSHSQGELRPNTHVSTLLLFGSIALLILVIGCINYMNLTTARSSIRMKEIGARKVVGAQRSQIASQFLGESLIMALISLGLSILLVHLFLPLFNSLAERSLSLNGESLLPIAPGMLALVLFVGLLGGSYPAFLLSSFKPSAGLKGGGRGTQKSRLRNVLVVVQFSASLILITSTLLVRSQLDYVRNKELGFERDRIVVVDLRDPGIRENAAPVIEELKRNPDVLFATASMHLPNEVGATTHATWPGKPEELEIRIKASEAGYDFVDLFGIKIVQGRNFSREFPSDAGGAFLVNESALKALGEHFRLGMEFRHWRGKGSVVGVMRDYHLNSLHEEIMPLYVFLNPKRGLHLSMKIKGGDVPRTIAYIQETMQKFSPHYPFEYQFFDDLFNRVYLNEQKMERMFAIFSLIAVFIACMGVFGLSIFMANQKRKEIGIRKVLGAPLSNIVCLLSRDLVGLVLLANLIGWPVAYYAMNRWLQNFAYRTAVKPGIFLLSALLTLLVSLGALSFQAVKAASSNPVDSLRYE